jgi:mono/diheme cytochrome c family protein
MLISAAAMLIAVAAMASGCSRWRRRAGESIRVPPGLLVSREARESGRALFLKNCAICHGESGAGDGPRSVGMIPAPRNLTIPPWPDDATAPRIYRSIRFGIAGTAMPSWKTLGDHQIWNLVAYVHSLGSP